MRWGWAELQASDAPRIPRALMKTCHIFMPWTRHFRDAEGILCFPAAFRLLGPQTLNPASRSPRNDREIVWVAGVGERVVQGQVICEVTRGEKQNPAEVLSPATGKILQHIFVRSDPRSGVNYTRVG